MGNYCAGTENYEAAENERNRAKKQIEKEEKSFFLSKVDYSTLWDCVT